MFHITYIHIENPNQKRKQIGDRKKTREFKRRNNNINNQSHTQISDIFIKAHTQYFILFFFKMAKFISPYFSICYQSNVLVLKPKSNYWKLS